MIIDGVNYSNSSSSRQSRNHSQTFRILLLLSWAANEVMALHVAHDHITYDQHKAESMPTPHFNNTYPMASESEIYFVGDSNRNGRIVAGAHRIGYNSTQLSDYIFKCFNFRHLVDEVLSKSVSERAENTVSFGQPPCVVSQAFQNLTFDANAWLPDRYCSTFIKKYLDHGQECYDSLQNKLSNEPENNSNNQLVMTVVAVASLILVCGSLVYLVNSVSKNMSSSGSRVTPMRDLTHSSNRSSESKDIERNTFKP